MISIWHVLVSVHMDVAELQKDLITTNKNALMFKNKVFKFDIQSIWDSTAFFIYFKNLLVWSKFSLKNEKKY